RGVYETPGGTLLHAAHRELEQLVLDRRTLRLRDQLALQYADLVYDGRWWTPEREALDAAIAATQRPVTGWVRLKLYKGGVTVTGRESPHALYQPSYATFGKETCTTSGMPRDSSGCTASRSASARGSTRRARPSSARRPTDGVPVPHRDAAAPDVGRALRARPERGAARAEPQPSRGPPAVAPGRHGEQGVGPRARPPGRARPRRGGRPARRVGPRRRAARRRRRRRGPGRRHPHAGRAAAVRRGRLGGGQAAHRALAQRSGRDRSATLEAGGERPAGRRSRTARQRARGGRPRR